MFAVFRSPVSFRKKTLLSPNFFAKVSETVVSREPLFPEASSQLTPLETRCVSHILTCSLGALTSFFASSAVLLAFGLCSACVRLVFDSCLACVQLVLGSAKLVCVNMLFIAALFTQIQQKYELQMAVQNRLTAPNGEHNEDEGIKFSPLTLFFPLFLCNVVQFAEFTRRPCYFSVCLPAVFMPTRGGHVYSPKAHSYFHPPGQCHPGLRETGLASTYGKWKDI